MNYKPSDFFIGITDFFALLLPGALLAAFLNRKIVAGKVFCEVFGSEMSTELVGTKGWIAFAISSYVLGHFASIVGGWQAGIANAFEDRFILGKPQEKPDAESQCKPQEKPDQKSHFTSWNGIKGLFSKSIFGRRRTQINQELLEGVEVVFKKDFDLRIATAYVQSRCAIAASQLERTAAIARFFRSFSVILIVIVSTRLPSFFCNIKQNGGVLLYLLIAYLFSLWLYTYQRWKHKELVYSYVNALNKNLKTDSSSSTTT